MGNVAERVVDLTPRMILAFMKTSRELIKLLEEFLEDKKNYDSAKLINEHLAQEGDVNFMICRGFAEKEWSKKLNELGIPHVRFQDKETGAIYFATRDCDKELVRVARKEFLAQQKKISNMHIKDFYNYQADKNVIRMDNLTEVQVKRFAEYANGKFIMSSTKEANGTYSIYFAEDDYQKAKTAYNKVVFDSIGVNGKLMNEQYSKEIKNVKEAYQAFTNSNAEVYVVSSTNPNEYIHFKGKEYDKVKNGKVFTESKIDDKFAQDVFNHSMELVNPVIVSKENYKKINDLISQQVEEHGFDEKDTASTIWKFIDKQFDGDTDKFINELENNKTRLSVDPNNKSEPRLHIEKDDEKVLLTQTEKRQLYLESKVKDVFQREGNLSVEDTLDKITEDITITNEERQYIDDFINNYYDIIENSKEYDFSIDDDKLLEVMEMDEPEI